jgi:hypothetical protein
MSRVRVSLEAGSHTFVGCLYDLFVCATAAKHRQDAGKQREGVYGACSLNFRGCAVATAPTGIISITGFLNILFL